MARGSGQWGQLFPQRRDVGSRPVLVSSCGFTSHHGRTDVPSPVHTHPCPMWDSPELPLGMGVSRDCRSTRF